ncbi:MAG TPA: DNA replication/repair protein RecF [Thermohalobaculum sp.]|nr:DNA replication/repair protein RecF [Thermohalobaculum sp.]
MARLAVGALRLAQFRSYERAEVRPEDRSVALHGPNGAGKTNLLEAVSMLVPGRGLRRAEAEALARRPGEPGWRVRAELATAAGAVEVVTGVEGAETRRTVGIDGKAATQARLGEIVRMVWLTPAMDRLWTEGAAERRRFLDRMTLGFEPGHGEVSIGYEKAMRGRNRLLREGPADPAWLGGLEAQMARAGARIARSRAAALDRLREAQNRAETLFPKAEMVILGDMETRFSTAIRDGADLDLAEADEAAGLAAALADGRARDAAAGRTLAGPHRSDLDAVYAAKGMPASACSTGEQKALLISLCLANARALTAETGAAPILLLDEVAAHLDAERRGALFAEVAALGCQAWMTGTGPELFADMGAGALRVEVAEEAGRSTLREARA